MKITRASLGALALGCMLFTSCSMPGQATNSNAVATNTNAAPANTITLNKNAFTSNESITVTYATAKLTDKAWLGIIPSATAHGSEATNDSVDVSYRYLSGSTSGNLSMDAPAQPGNYDIRLSDGGLELASVSFTVSGGAGADIKPAITLDKTTYKAGEALSGKFNAPSTLDKNAWIGIIPSSAAHGDEAQNDAVDVGYIYLGGKTEGALSDLMAPTQPGSYDLRLNENDSGGKELTSVTFTVQ